MSRSVSSEGNAITYARAFAVIGLILLLPATVAAQAAGICLFSGSMTWNPPLTLEPRICDSAGGCNAFTFQGSLTGPGCLSLSGSIEAPRSGLVFGGSSCLGNVHGGVFEHSPSGKVFSFYGVCAGPFCTGAAMTTFGALQYDLFVDPSALSRCAAGSFSTASVNGVVSGIVP